MHVTTVNVADPIALEERIEIANPQHPHCATVLLLDTSASMAGDKIRQLNEGLRFFKDDVMSDDLARKRVEVAVVTFGGTVQIAHDFTGIDTFDPAPARADGGTPMGEAILRGIELLRDRKQGFKQAGVDYYRPWIFLITDGEPTDVGPGDPMWNRVVRAVHAGDAAGEFVFFAVGVEPADMDVLAMIAPGGRPPMRLRPGRFKELFAWLSASQRRVSASRVGEQLALPAPSGWAQIGTG